MSTPTDPDGPAPGYDPQLVTRVLDLLRQWGWEAAWSQFREHIDATTDPRTRAELEVLSGWIAAERGGHEEAVNLFDAAGVQPELVAWALVGRAFVAYRAGQFDRAQQELDEAVRRGCGSDTVLHATLDHVQGVVWFKRGRTDEALERLYAALDRFGLGHFGTGRVLDSLGMVYASRNDFPNAVLFYARAEELKKVAAGDRPDDLAGLAVTYGQLGRLYLDWHLLDRAEEHFRADLKLCVRILDRRGEAQMYDHLGQVALLRDKPARARELLDQSVRMNQEGGWGAGEGYARKDRAAALVALGQLGAAEADLTRAAELFAALNFREGQAHVGPVRAALLGAQGRFTEAEEALRRAAVWFDTNGEPAPAARAYLDLARLYRRTAGALGVPRETLLLALGLAERSRRDALVAAVERELAEVDEVELYRRLYLRARGRGIRDDIGAMDRATGEKATVLFLDLRESTLFVKRVDPAVVRLTLNQLFALLAEALEPHKVVINQYLGDGFMALSREGDHARNAVLGALDALDALEQFNRPRRALGQLPLEARIGISTGDVVLGNIGTHQKVDFTAVGPTTNEAARLQGHARAGLVCVSDSTYRVVGDQFEYADPKGRSEPLKDFGTVHVWDVKARAADPA